MKTAPKIIWRLAISTYVVLSMTVFIATAHEPIEVKSSTPVANECINTGVLFNGEHYPAGS